MTNEPWGCHIENGVGSGPVRQSITGQGEGKQNVIWTSSGPGYFSSVEVVGNTI